MKLPNQIDQSPGPRDIIKRNKIPKDKLRRLSGAGITKPPKSKFGRTAEKSKKMRKILTGLSGPAREGNLIEN